MNILVTGSAGFIGTNLTKRLLENGNKVIGVDSFYSGQEKNLKIFYLNPNFKFIKHDVRERLPLDRNVDQIYHLACPASPPRYQQDPKFTLDTSIDGTRNMLELANQKNASILFSSTSEIYGNPLEHPQKESYWGNVNAIGERSNYDEGKRVAETYCYLYKKLGVDIRVARIFNTYGPYMDSEDGRVVSNFIIQALKNKDITIYGTGKQTRSFCYVDDLIEGLIKFMNLKERYFGPINLGNPEELSIIELSEKVKNLTESKSEIIFKPLPADDPEKRKPDITRAREVLQWEPKIQFEEGLKNTIKYFKSENQ